MIIVLHYTGLLWGLNELINKHGVNKYTCLNISRFKSITIAISECGCLAIWLTLRNLTFISEAKCPNLHSLYWHTPNPFFCQYSRLHVDILIPPFTYRSRNRKRALSSPLFFPSTPDQRYGLTPWALPFFPDPLPQGLSLLQVMTLPGLPYFQKHIWCEMYTTFLLSPHTATRRDFYAFM